jgi:bifunctional DNA-binding transcriptional regulator/antitoxin component of YhaV-PrlF toxin-antitoxin module
MKNTSKVWKAGTDTLVITVPKNIRELQNIQEGDYVEANFEKVEKKQNNNSKKNKITVK